jgi:glycosyltransferase involved in cell wall biosynthesis
MRLCIISRACGFGGVGKRILEISKELSMLGVEVHIITMNNKENTLEAGEDYPNLHIHKVPFFSLPYLPPRPVPNLYIFNLLSYLKFRKLNKKYCFDFVEAQQNNCTLLHILKHVPIITVVHGCTYVYLKKGYVKGLLNYPLSYIQGLIEGFEARRSDLVVSVSEYVKRELIECHRVDPENIAVVYNGVDPDSCNHKKNRDIQILAVGSLMKFKGFFFLLEAMKEIVKKIPEAKLLIVGRGPEERRLKTFCEENSLTDNVYFKDWTSTEELNKLYSACGVFVHAPEYEAFGMVVLEAMACGAAVVTSAAGGIPEVVGDAGIVLEDSNANNIASAVLNLLEDKAKRERLSEKAISRSKMFGWSKIADTYYNLLVSLQSTQSDEDVSAK